LAAAVEMTPYSRDEYSICHEYNENDVERVPYT